MTTQQSTRQGMPGRVGRNGRNGLIPTANIAANVSAQAETEPADTVIMPVNNRQSETVNVSPDMAVTPLPVPNVSHCEHCGAEFTPRRSHARFCSPYCRRLAWLDRNPERAAVLAERDRQRLKEHIIASGGEWREKVETY